MTSSKVMGGFDTQGLGVGKSGPFFFSLFHFLFHFLRPVFCKGGFATRFPLFVFFISLPSKPSILRSSN
jgi:hypothetical protein